jgi:hypothetical protein
MVAVLLWAVALLPIFARHLKVGPSDLVFSEQHLQLERLLPCLLRPMPLSKNVV